FQDLVSDFLFCSAYKFFGPHVGIVAIKQETFEDLTPYKLEPAPNSPPEKSETGTINFEALAGVKDTVEFIANIGNGNLLREKLNSAFKKISQYEEYIANRLRRALKQMNHIKLLQDD